jgi:hypothetical protein
MSGAVCRLDHEAPRLDGTSGRCASRGGTVIASKHWSMGRSAFGTDSPGYCGPVGAGCRGARSSSAWQRFRGRKARASRWRRACASPAPGRFVPSSGTTSLRRYAISRNTPASSVVRSCARWARTVHQEITVGATFHPMHRFTDPFVEGLGDLNDRADWLTHPLHLHGEMPRAGAAERDGIGD